jgi:hypothetical protein
MPCPSACLVEVGQLVLFRCFSCQNLFHSDAARWYALDAPGSVFTSFLVRLETGRASSFARRLPAATRGLRMGIPGHACGGSAGGWGGAIR